METKFNFKSQICTSREQSERLLALGLKKGTADCYWWQENDQYGDGNGKWHLEVLDTKEARERFEYLDKIFDDELFIPAWSLGRLVEDLMPEKIKKFDSLASLIVSKGKVQYYFHDVEYSDYLTSAGCWKDENIYNNIIDCIEWIIKEGYFNKEYLV